MVKIGWFVFVLSMLVFAISIATFVTYWDLPKIISYISCFIYGMVSMIFCLMKWGK